MDADCVPVADEDVVDVDPDSVEDSLKADRLVPLPSSTKEFETPETLRDSTNDCIPEACARFVSFGFSRSDIVREIFGHQTRNLVFHGCIDDQFIILMHNAMMLNRNTRRKQPFQFLLFHPEQIKYPQCLCCQLPVASCLRVSVWQSNQQKRARSNG